MTQTFKRRNLPHLYDCDGTYFITYRLANSLPATALEKLEHKMNVNNFSEFKNLFLKYDSLLDSSSYGIDYLSKLEIAGVCKSTLHHPDNKEFRLICYSIMPNHIHLVFELLEGNRGIGKIMQGIKGTSARYANIKLNRKGKFWQDESYDRLIRDDVELYFTVRYVLLNPVSAGLVNDWREWEFTYCRPDFIMI